MELERKEIDLFEAKFEAKTDGEQGIIEGYASTFGNKDLENEVVDEGAFKKHLSHFKKYGKILWNHNRDDPIGPVVEDGSKKLQIKEDERGLWFRAKITKSTQAGKETISLIKDGIIDGLSIGYRVIDDELKDGIRHLKEIELWDISPVTYAANPQAEIVSVKKLGEKGVIPFKETPKASEGTAWSAAAQVAQADISDLKTMCTWYDPANAENKIAYKLPHHLASDSHAVVLRGVMAAGGVMMGARGGANIPVSDVSGVKNHLAKHYHQFDREAPWESEKGYESWVLREFKKMLEEGKEEAIKTITSSVEFKELRALLELYRTR